MSKTFQQVTDAEDVLLVVDSLNLAFRYKHKGEFDFAEDYLRTVNSLKKSYKAKYVIIAGDHGSSSYRKGLYPEYKQNRKDKFAEQTEAERLEFEMFLQGYGETLEHLATNSKYPIIRFPGVEADDIAAYIVSRVTNRKFHTPIKHTWLVSSDRDWDLLVGDKVSRFSYVTRKEVTVENWHTHYEFPIEEYISIKCLTGDSGDNVPGVPGIGPKRAASLVAQYGSTYDIIDSIPIAGKYKHLEALNSMKDQLVLNYQLMDLVAHCGDALGSDNCSKIDTLLQEYIN